MKKILASLLSVAILSTSVGLCCFAEEGKSSAGQAEEKILTSDQLSGENLANGQADATNLNGTSFNATESNETNLNETSFNATSTNRTSFYKAFINETQKALNNSLKFCKSNQKEIAIGGTVTAVVVLVATIFRNEIKQLVKKISNAVKRQVNKVLA